MMFQFNCFEKTRKKILIGSLAIFLAFFVFAPVMHAQETSDGGNKAIEGLNQSGRAGYLGDKTGANTPIEVGEGVMVDIPTSVGKIVGAALAFLGVIFLLLII